MKLVEVGFLFSAAALLMRAALDLLIRFDSIGLPLVTFCCVV